MLSLSYTSDTSDRIWGNKKVPRAKNTLTVIFKAGDCRYYKAKHPDIGQSWEEQGLLEFAHAPDSFQPDLQKIAVAPGQLGQLAELLRHYDESQLRILMCVLHDSYKLRTVGLKFGQPVYKNLSAPEADYVDCWFRSYVIAVGPKIAGVPYVYISGSLDDIHGTLMMVPVESILTRKEFKVHRSQLELEGKLKSPLGERSRLVRHTHSDLPDEEFPTLEEVADRLVAVDYEPTEDDEEEDDRPARRGKRSGRSIKVEIS